MRPILSFSWEMMNEDFFEKVLREGLNDATIKKVKIKNERPAVGKGENFLSTLMRFTLNYSKDECEKFDEISLIVKYEPIGDGPNLKLIKSQNIFGTEVNIFKIILPDIEKLVGSKLAPKCFYRSENPSIIVLEDLSPLGFKPKDRQLGLSMSHVLMVLDRIAKFHAASVYLYEKNEDSIKCFTKGIMTEETPKNMFRVIEQTLEMVCNEVTNWNDIKYSQIADKLRSLKDKFAEEIVNVTKYNEKEFCVLNHGDCWINNIMFREDKNGKPLEVLLIDYQMSVYSSPVIDLIYFLSVCPAIDLKCDKDDFFLTEYLRILTKTMISLGCKTKSPTIEDLKKSMLQRRMWIVMSAVAFYPRMIADISEIETFDEILGTGVTKMNIFKNPNAKIALQKQLPAMEEKGYLD